MPNRELLADICLVCEGTYPYISGGVATWAHELILSQPQLTFHLVCLLPPDGATERRYTVPDNVLSITNVFVQNIPSSTVNLRSDERSRLFQALELPLLNLQHKPTLAELARIMQALRSAKGSIGSDVLLDSHEAFNMLLRMYFSMMADTSFLDYFWTWRGLLAGLYSILLAPMPSARMFHSLCTGYAGLYLARARVELGRPCLLTEHGIYTNERKIEITAAQWLQDLHEPNLNINRRRYQRDLRDFWIDSFFGYASLCYEASDSIITLSEVNRSMQLADGADAEKIRIIPNGIDYDRYGSIKRVSSASPTVALIGRVVPIKDIKTFLRAVAYVCEQLPHVQVLVIGPTNEDPDYYQECLTIVQSSGLSSKVTFTGKVTIDEFLPRIDVVVLTSISEGQPLVLLEAGAAGIPSVCTDVGDCRSLVYGRVGEAPALGEGGVVTVLADPVEVGKSILTLLTDRTLYDRCSQAMKQRVKAYYQMNRQANAYRDIYDALLAKNEAGS